MATWPFTVTELSTTTSFSWTLLVAPAIEILALLRCEEQAAELVGGGGGRRREAGAPASASASSTRAAARERVLA